MIERLMLIQALCCGSQNEKRDSRRNLKKTHIKRVMINKNNENDQLGGGFKYFNISYFYPYTLGDESNLTSIFFKEVGSTTPPALASARRSVEPASRKCHLVATGGNHKKNATLFFLEPQKFLVCR